MIPCRTAFIKDALNTSLSLFSLLSSPLTPLNPVPFPSLFQSCTERMKELSGQLKHNMLEEIDDLSRKVTESTRGLMEQVSTILSMPPPRVLLYQSPRAGQEGRATGLPPGRSTLQAPKREHGHERRWSGDKRSGDKKGFTSTL